MTDNAQDVEWLLRLGPLLNEPSKEMIDAGQTALEDCTESGFDSDADGNSHDYTWVHTDAVVTIFKAMLVVAARQAACED